MIPSNKNDTVDSKRKDNNSAPSSGAGKSPEQGGPKGPEPTRYGDWERKGRCIDF
ncbi:MAG: DUF1674 domain-containing protein [Gammaproteobacteria bacterium]